MTTGRGANPYLAEFAFMAAPKPSGVGFRYLDHVTHNVFKGNMDRWFDFYSRLFNFRQIRFFDIEGKYTGLSIHALTSPCGRIRIPIHEDSGETGQNDEYFKRYKGEGVQHLVLGCGKIYSTTEAIAARGLKLMPKPLMAIYALSKIRVGASGDDRRDF